MDSDIAIVGFSFKMPDEAEDELGFWRILEQKRNVMSEWPKDRLNIDSFYEAEANMSNKLHSRGAHFLKQDPAAFDAPFFSITAKEAASMDPQHRMVLEASYRAFENAPAGMPVEHLKGTRTGVFASSMSDDYRHMTVKDSESMPAPTIAGTALALLPNRVSWHFDLMGPSVHIDTACSSSMVALDMACQSLKTGDATMALVAGGNLILGPESSLMLSNGNYLSPDSVCYSFDHRANGYARGEGIVVIVIKPLNNAIQDGDMIRAVIRSTGSNQDGRTPSLSQPSADSQEQLIRHVYEKAGLDFNLTRFIEAHGTGTPVGDPAEMKAIGRIFRPHRSTKEPLYVGSVKSNIGHLEGAAGLAGVVKAVLMLEKGIIPPNANFEKINPDIDAEFYNVAIPTKCIAWPKDGLRRISINSFGFGGSNAHAVIDDAYHYLANRGVNGNHQTIHSPVIGSESDRCGDGLTVIRDPHTLLTNGDSPSNEKDPHLMSHGDITNGQQRALNGARPASDGTISIVTSPPVNGNANPESTSRILVWTAADEATLKKMVQAYNIYLRSNVGASQTNLNQLADTLATHRSLMLWRTFAVIDAKTAGDIATDSKTLFTTKPTRASTEVSPAFIFTGQGAQYAGMGMQLIRWPVFQGVLQQIDSVFSGLGCTWSLFDALSQCSNINRPEYAQPLCTALQIALVELLKSFGVTPTVVMGHSSGEIAAAYASGALSLASACKVAYYRGQLAAKLKESTQTPGAMLSANLPAPEVQEYLKLMGSSELANEIHVACINSPLNSTLSGPEAMIDLVKEILDKNGIFAQKLNTGVPYHSPAMTSIKDEYEELIGSLEPGNSAESPATLMVSSLTGQPINSPIVLSSAKYWVDNLISPVKFSDALRSVQEQLKTGAGKISHLIEVGPHPALRRSIQDTLKDVSKKRQPLYSHVLMRSKEADQAMLEFVGQLFCSGYDVSIPAANQNTYENGPIPFSVDCPPYPFNHSRTYWQEARLSRDFRLREMAPTDTLGARFHDWNPLQPRWRNFMSVESLPWVKSHVIAGTILYPGAGLLIIALEAVKQICPAHRQLSGYYIKEANFIGPVIISDTPEKKTETIIQLQQIRTPYEKESVWSEVKIMTQIDDQWTECFRATIQSQYESEGNNEVDGGLERQLRDEGITNLLHQVSEACDQRLDRQAFYECCHESGIMYGDSFKRLDDIRWDGGKYAMGQVDFVPELRTSSLVHPIVLDCALQVLLAQCSNGLQEGAPTFVPSQICDTWMAASGWQPPQTSSVRAFAKRNVERPGLQAEATIHVVSDDCNPLCIIGKIVMSQVSNKAYSQTHESKMLYSINWKPQLSLMGREALRHACDTDSITEDGTMANFRQVLEPTLEEVLRRTIRELTDSDYQKIPEHLQKHLHWMQKHIARSSFPQGEVIDAESPQLDELLRDLESLYPPWKIFPAIARNLKPILLGEIDPLEIAFNTGLAESFYADIFTNICDDKFRKLLELISHEHPKLRILEVGAGTGGMTSHVLSALGGIEGSTGGNRFSMYTYTDISPSFFETARDRFQEFGNRMDFKVFDLDNRCTEQGFEEGSYDLIVAGAVLHATANLEATLNNLRALLRPNGHLLCLEVVSPENITTNFAFGTLPGWWKSTEDYRSLSPTITEQQWDHVLRHSGFSGNDLVLRDYQDDAIHTFSMLLSTVTSPASHTQSRADVTLLLVHGPFDHRAISIAESLQRHLEGYEARIVYLDQMRDTQISESHILVCLLEVSTPFISRMTEPQYLVLKDIIARVQRLLWVASTSPKDNYHPEYDLMQGFIRSIRSENIDKHIVTLAVDQSAPQGDPLECAAYSAMVFKESFVANSDELEYRVQDGSLVTARLEEARPLEAKMTSLMTAQRRDEPWNTGVPVKLAIGMSGFLDTLEFVVDDTYLTDLAPDDVEVASKAWGMNFRDIFVALGRLPGDDLGYDCAGVVTRLGSSHNTTLQVGDRVFGGKFGCMRTYVRASATNFVKIPDDLSFEQAASVLAPGLTAYYSFIHAARLVKGEKVLIHSASGATGQMAIWIAKMVGAEIFATVGFNEKKQFLIDEFGIDADHIFYSRDTSFSHGIMRVTRGYGVDVVLNSLSGDGLRASWECMAPHGRFIEIGKADIEANSALPMSHFSRNVSFFAVDLHHLAHSRPEFIKQLREEMLQLLASGDIHHPRPLSVYSAENIEQAFRFLQSGKSTGRIIISVNDSDVVPKRIIERDTWKLDPNATYVIVGAWGGLGREISIWMANKGAKHLLLLSRSGPVSEKAAEVVAELKRRGIDVRAPKCDVSSKAALSTILQQTAMPPIKGCINSAMALNDILFDKMTYDQWRVTIHSKMQTSWNLHELLPQSLDFFVLLSSLSGIYGSITQSNYAAGCTFQDALARHRVSQGQKAVSFDLGWMRNIGIVAETAAYQQTRKSAADMMPVDDAHLMALLEIYCNPEHCITSIAESQLLVGAVTPADCLARGSDPPTLALRPMFSGFSLVMGGKQDSETNGGLVNYTAMFLKAENFEERTEVVLEWLSLKLARAMSITVNDIERSRQLSDYGVDSLMAVELRNWIAKDFGANMAVFEIMGGTSIAAIGNLVVEKSEMVKTDA